MFNSLFGYAHDSYRARMAEDEAERVGRKALEIGWEVRDVESRLDRLSLVCMAMWELLKGRTDLTEDDLMAKVRELDLMDGRPDGKLKQKTIARCPNCNRTMSPRHARCLYCGTQNLQAEAWDGVL